MGFNAFWLGADSVTRGNWSSPQGSLGKYIFNTPNNVYERDQLRLGVSYTFGAGVLDWARRPTDDSDPKSLLLPGGGRSNAHLLLSGSQALACRVERLSGPVVFSVYCLDVSGGQVPLTAVASSAYLGQAPADEVPYAYDGDYADGVWLRCAVNAQGNAYIHLASGVACQGFFIDPYSPHTAGEFLQGFVGHGAF